MLYTLRIVRKVIWGDLIGNMGLLLSMVVLFLTGGVTLYPAIVSALQDASPSTTAVSEHPLPATAAHPEAAATIEPPVEPLLSHRYAMLLLKDTGHVLSAPLRWSLRDWALFGADTALVIGTAAALDRPIQKYAQRNRKSSSNTLASVFDPLGNEYALAVPGGFYLVGVVWHNTKAKAVAQDGLAASLVEAGIIAPAMKLATGRSRPKAGHGAYYFAPFKGEDVFPSGHTGEAFTLASVVAEHYDPLWVKVTAYGVASLVGVARIIDNAHFASDVVAGALIGTAVGQSVVRFNKQQRVQVSPLLGGTTKGVRVVYAF